MNEPLRQLEVRVGSATDALTPLSRATRSFAATPVQWLSLGAIAIAAIVADQVTKHIVAANLALGDRVHVVGPFAIRHVRNSGIAFGLFAHATAGVIEQRHDSCLGGCVGRALRHPLVKVKLRGIDG